MKTTNRSVRSTMSSWMSVNLVTALDRAEDRIETVHVVGSDYLTLTTGDKTIPASEFGDHLESEGHSVHQIDVLEERDFAE